MAEIFIPLSQNNKLEPINHPDVQACNPRCLPTTPPPCIPDVCVPDAICPPTNPALSSVNHQTSSNKTEFLWLEITKKCQLNCSHCYTESSPQAKHGPIDTDGWKRIIDEAADLGVKQTVIIGGEPTTRKDLPDIVNHALERGIKTEIFTNLFTLTQRTLETFKRPGVSVATSYYSANPEVHDRITGRLGSYERTKANIAKIAGLGIPIRVGITRTIEKQDIDEAVAELIELGVPKSAIQTDDMREVGRGIREKGLGTEQLCGSCATGRAAVMPDGKVYPCVFARWLPVGDTQNESLSSILQGEKIKRVRNKLNEAFVSRRTTQNDDTY